MDPAHCVSEARHSDDQELRWHLRRVLELDQILDAASLDDHAVDVSVTTVSDAAAMEVAMEVAGLVGWTR